MPKCPKSLPGSPTESTDFHKELPAWSHPGPCESRGEGHIIANALRSCLLLKHLSTSWGVWGLTRPHSTRNEIQSSASLRSKKGTMEREAREVSCLYPFDPTTEHVGNTGAEKQAQGCISPCASGSSKRPSDGKCIACPLLQLCVAYSFFPFLSPDEHLMQRVQILGGSNLTIWAISELQRFYSTKRINK